MRDREIYVLERYVGTKPRKGMGDLACVTNLFQCRFETNETSFLQGFPSV